MKPKNIQEVTARIATTPQSLATLGSACFLLRMANGLSLNQVSELSGVAPSTVSRFEQGNTHVSIATVMAILDGLGYTINAHLEVKPME